MCSYANQFAFVSGGQSFKNSQNMTKVVGFDLEKDKWYELPSLNYGRHGHSSTFIGDAIYVYGSNYDSIERLEFPLATSAYR